MEYRILGTLEVRRAGEPVPIRAGKTRDLLALLLIEAGETLTADRLVEELWGAEPPETGANALQVYVARLRKALEPGRPSRSPSRILVTESSGYRLDIAPDELDAARFEELVTRGSDALARGTAEEAAMALREALGLWRGPALVDVAYAPFAQAEIRRLEELRAHAIEERIEADLALGRHADVVAELEGLVAAHPLRERLRCHLALALYRSGRQPEALGALRAARRILVEEHGLDPGTALEELEAAILSRDASLDVPSRPSAPVASTAPTNLPIPRTSFVGREDELSLVADLIGGPGRLVTLTGPGGCGKTRLAVEAARSMLGRFPDGTWLVKLGPLSDPALVPRAVAAAMGNPEEPRSDLEAALASSIADGLVLLVLDNIEHVAEAAARIAHTVLSACAHVRVLATGREPLGLDGETLVNVPSLSVPASSVAAPDEALRSSEAVRLFVDRARSRWPGFELERRNVGAVTTIVRRLDGIPLAIELAAANLGTMTEDVLAERIDDRFALLVAGDRTAHPRQRTLRALVDWSHDLLDDSERVLLRRIGVFADAFTLEGAEAVCGWDPIERHEVIPLLSRLVRASLVSVATRDRGRPRYRMLETIREYARELLAEAGEETGARRRHLDLMTKEALQLDTEWTQAQKADLGSGVETVWHGVRFNHAVLAEVAAEQDDFRAALRWAIDSRSAEAALTLATAMWLPWRATGFWNELPGWFDEVLSIAGDASPELRGLALGVAASMAGQQGDWDRRIGLATEGLELFGPMEHHLGLGWMWHAIGHAHGIQDRVEESEACYASGVAEHRLAGDPFSLAFTQFVWAWMLVARGEHERAREMAEEVRRISTEHELDEPLAQAEVILGFLAARTDPEAGRRRYEEAIASTAGSVELHYSLLATGRLELGRPELHAQARDKVARSIRIARRIGFPERRRWELESAAAAAALRGSLDGSARLLGAAERARELLGTECPFPAQDVVDHVLRKVPETLGLQRAEPLIEQGRSMPLHRSLDLALASLEER